MDTMDGCHASFSGAIQSGAAEVPKQHGAQVELLAEATEEEDHKIPKLP